MGKPRLVLVVVAALLGSSCWAAQAGAYVYWANGGPSTIGRANLDGSSANQSFISGASTPDGVAVDGQHIYWANEGGTTIGRANLDGSGTNESFISGASTPVGVVVDGQHIYWANWGSGTGTTIGRANLNGTSVEQSFIGGASAPAGVVVDGQHIYWANYGGTTIGRANLNGTSPNQSFITGASEPAGVVVDGQHIYWANKGSTTIGRANLDGTSPNQSFITVATKPAGLAVDGQHIYWATYGGTTLGRANLDGSGANESFITGANVALGMAVDGDLTVSVAGSGSISADSGAISGCSSGGGTCTGPYNEGATITLTATPGAHNKFSGWSGADVGSCDQTGATLTCPVTIPTHDAAITATFAQIPPTVLTGSASGITQTTATVAGTVNPNGSNVTACHIDYGTSTAYGSSVACAPSPGSGTSAVNVSGSLSGLTAGTTYHYRVLATNAGGTTPGGDETFATQSVVPAPTCATDALLCPPAPTCATDPLLCPPAPKTATLTLASSTSTVKAGKAPVKLSCTGDSGATCSGKVELTITVTAKKGKRTTKKSVTVGSATVNIAAGKNATVSVKLSSTAIKLLAKQHKLSATVTGPAKLKHGLTLNSSKAHK